MWKPFVLKPCQIFFLVSFRKGSLKPRGEKTKESNLTNYFASMSSENPSISVSRPQMSTNAFSGLNNDKNQILETQRYVTNEGQEENKNWSLSEKFT